MIRKPRGDLRLNVKPREALLRLGLGLGLPFLLIWLHSTVFITMVILISTYLLITGMLFFCFIKYFFQHTITKRKRPTKEENEMPFKEL